MVAVQQTCRALLFVPEHLRTEELYRAAAQKDGKALGWIPDEHITASLAMAAVQQNGCVLKECLYGPIRLVTASLAMAAVQQTGHALQFVPEGLNAAAIRHTSLRKSSPWQRSNKMASPWCMPKTPTRHGHGGGPATP